MTVRLAAVEAGGTTFVCAIALDEPTNVLERAEFPTTTPAETIGRCVEWLSAREYDALGIASFGPIDLAPASKTYGYITTTPKPKWAGTDIVGPLRAVRTHARTHGHARTHARAHPPTRTRAHAHTDAQTHAHARARARTHARTDGRARTHRCARTRPSRLTPT